MSKNPSGPTPVNRVSRANASTSNFKYPTAFPFEVPPNARLVEDSTAALKLGRRPHTAAGW